MKRILSAWGSWRTVLDILIVSFYIFILQRRYPLTFLACPNTDQKRKWSNSAERNAPPASQNITGNWLERMRISSILEEVPLIWGWYNGKRTIVVFTLDFHCSWLHLTMNLKVCSNFIDLAHHTLNCLIFSLVQQPSSLVIAAGYISISCKRNEIYLERLSLACFKIHNINILIYFNIQTHARLSTFFLLITPSPTTLKLSESLVSPPQEGGGMRAAFARKLCCSAFLKVISKGGHWQTNSCILSSIYRVIVFT